MNLLQENQTASTYVYKTAWSSHNPSENLNFDERLCLENEISVHESEAFDIKINSGKLPFNNIPLITDSLNETV
ncbi:CLUMA_CG010076, isoform A [Clunio marinus]|uniref:CLUMA_CG010076, isoform A n=1 Tax=Clunio marinus TaxID=568069 RepID=A0A1J1IAX2_9DIPT|nr:CLUMA_CG010076, isoform A [Clunio marinus]